MLARAGEEEVGALVFLIEGGGFQEDGGLARGGRHLAL